jgi:hypothetical protein
LVVPGGTRTGDEGGTRYLGEERGERILPRDLVSLRHDGLVPTAVVEGCVGGRRGREHPDRHFADLRPFEDEATAVRGCEGFRRAVASRLRATPDHEPIEDKKLLRKFLAPRS